MQNGYAANFLKRVQFYGAVLITLQVGRGKACGYSFVVIILILRRHIPLQDTDLDGYHFDCGSVSWRQYLKDLSHVFVELDLFKNEGYELETS